MTTKKKEKSAFTKPLAAQKQSKDTSNNVNHVKSGFTHNPIKIDRDKDDHWNEIASNNPLTTIDNHSIYCKEPATACLKGCENKTVDRKSNYPDNSTRKLIPSLRPLPFVTRFVTDGGGGGGCGDGAFSKAISNINHSSHDKRKPEFVRTRPVLRANARTCPSKPS